MGGESLLGCTVLAGWVVDDALLCRRMRRRCLPVAPVLLANVRPVVGVGKGANVTVLLLVGTLRDASVGAVGCGDRGTVVARGVATLRDVTGSGFGVTEGGTTGGVSAGSGGRVAGASGGAAMVERMLVS